MCGIVGAISQRNVAQILIEGLKRLEYRGYDSAGIAIITSKDNSIERLRVLGKVAKLEEALRDKPLRGHIGIAHTRWATHGKPNTTNAHPHFSNDEIAVVHNGIIENHLELRKKLINLNYEFKSETDTEVIAHLIHYYLTQTNNMLEAIRLSSKELKGAYALGIITKRNPTQLYAIRKGSPLVIGVGIDENFIASDALALLSVTQKFIYLEEGDIAQLSSTQNEIFDSTGKLVKRKIQLSQANIGLANKGKYRHFMLKEIFDQPEAITNTLQGYIVDNRLVNEAFGHKAQTIFQKIKRVHIVACGTSYHAGLVACHWFETIAGLPTQVEVASENRYRNPVIEDNTLFVSISQSGETADTLAALRQAKAKGYFATLGICNVAQSSLARETDLIFLTRAGIEIGVAATKTFTAQLVALALLALALGQEKSAKQIQQFIQELKQLPNHIKSVLSTEIKIKKMAKQFIDKQHALFIGRGMHHPIAMEGALKLKEISYLHAEAYPAGELKHGPLALVDENMPVIVIAPNNHLIEKLASNVAEIQARGGDIYVLSDHPNCWKSGKNMQLIDMPTIANLFSPIIYTIPLQLLSYYVAVQKGTDVDQPRNLAKSVTVE